MIKRLTINVQPWFVFDLVYFLWPNPNLNQKLFEKLAENLHKNWKIFQASWPLFKMGQCVVETGTKCLNTLWHMPWIVQCISYRFKLQYLVSSCFTNSNRIVTFATVMYGNKIQVPQVPTKGGWLTGIIFEFVWRLRSFIYLCLGFYWRNYWSQRESITGLLPH